MILDTQQNVAPTPKVPVTAEPVAPVQAADSIEAIYLRKLAAFKQQIAETVHHPHSNAYKTLNLEGSRSLTLAEQKIAEEYDHNIRI